MAYEEQLKTSEWQYVRQRVMERDRFRCQECKTERNLQVHHKYYTKGLKAWEYNDSALVTLCDKCHKFEHKKADPIDRLEIALNRLVRVAGYGVREWCQKQFPKEDGQKTD